MRAVLITAYDGASESLRVADVALPAPGPGEVLVKMHAAPINPSDLAFMRGTYAFRKALPAIAGFEGSGTVVASGSGVLPRLLAGKRVACALADPRSGSGTWAEYALAPALRCVPLRRNVDLDQAASMFVNPLMAWALVAEARRGHHRAAVANAAAGALGKMLVRLARRFRLPLINIVRRPDQVDLLREIGAEHVLDSSQPSFDADLRRLCTALNATIGFDAVTGELSGRMLRAQPKGSRLIVYGSLSESPALVDPRSLIFDEKQVSGLWLSSWMSRWNPLQQLRITGRVQALLSTDLASAIQGRFALENVRLALERYTAAMSAGKILLVPSR
ncbi:MAG: zinc-binding dehydrogenase [Candidatus Eremiobacteraeota bacterium]|nr:zinc-binding dehydrogenase [Candidatus Eremiobacteraeota bacterium]